MRSLQPITTLMLVSILQSHAKTSALFWLKSTFVPSSDFLTDRFATFMADFYDLEYPLMETH